MLSRHNPNPRLIIGEPITAKQQRITDALRYLRGARTRGDPTIEWAWQQQLDDLLDNYPMASN